MGDNFKVGDVVVCVDVGMHNIKNTSANLLKLYKLYRIDGVAAGSKTRCFSVSLRGLKSKDASGMFFASRFRKLPKADASFIRQLRALTPKEDNHA